MARIAVVGSINIDLVAEVPRLPLEGETVSGSSFSTISGGKGANQAVCAARLGGAVQLIGRLGDDLFAAQLRAELDAAGVETHGIRHVPGPSGTALITVSDAGANAIVVIPGANGAMQPAALEEHLEQLREASMVLAQLEIPLATVEHLGGLAERLGIPFMLDPAPAQKLTPDLLSKVTWLTPNEREACTLLRALGVSWSEELPDDLLVEAAQHLLHHGAKNVVLKLGGRGAFLMGRDVQPTRVLSFPVRVADTTAAGDAFNGGFAYALTHAGMEPAKAARFACAVAAFSVTRKGAQPGMPNIEEVQDLLKQHAAKS